jgi:hypothetical protein
VSTIKSSAENLTLNADGANNDVIIQSNGSTKVTLDGSGKLGIGTTGTPNRMLTLEGDGNEPDISLIQLDNTNDNYNEIRFLSVGSDDSTRRQGAGVKAVYTNHNSQTNPVTDLSFETRNAAGTYAERMRIDSEGDIDVGTGDIVFKTAGKGICLGVTSNTDANTLDDYEEGTWTPTLLIDGSTTGTTQVSANQGSYTKIGNRVFLDFYCAIEDKGSETGAITYGGLPFTTANNLTNTSIDGGGNNPHFFTGVSGVSDFSIMGWGGTADLKLYKKTCDTCAMETTMGNAQITDTFNVRASVVLTVA